MGVVVLLFKRKHGLWCCGSKEQKRNRNKSAETLCMIVIEMN